MERRWRGQTITFGLGQFSQDQAELDPEFVANIERGQADLRDGRVRVR